MSGWCLILIYELLFLSLNNQLEGNWKLIDYTGFTTLIGGNTFEKFSEEEKLNVIQGMEYVLNNTVYEFRGDSIFFTNAAPDFTVSEKKGRFLLKSDTLVVFESDKVNPIKFFISSISENELRMKFIRNNGELGPTEMIFERQN